MNNINTAFYGTFGATTVGLGIGGALLGSKLMLGGALVSAAALAVFAVIQSHQSAQEGRQGDMLPSLMQGPSYGLTLLSCASILGAGGMGIVLGSNALIIAALVAATLLVMQSDVALQRVAGAAQKSLRSAHENLDLSKTALEEFTESQGNLEQLLTDLQQNNQELYEALKKRFTETQAS